MRGRAWKRAFDAALTDRDGRGDDRLWFLGRPAGTQAAPTQPAATQASTTTASTPKEFVSERYDFAVALPQAWSESMRPSIGMAWT